MPRKREPIKTSEAPVTVARGLDDAVLALRAEGHENICRKPFSPFEDLAWHEREEPEEKAASAERKREAGKKYGRGRPKKDTGTSGNLNRHAGEASERAAKKTGRSERTNRKTKFVRDVAKRYPDEMAPDAAYRAREARHGDGRGSGP